MSQHQIFETYQLGELKLKNRFAMAPLTRGRAGNERIPNELMATYYKQRSGAGLIITEATVVSSEGIGWIDSPGIYTPEMTNGWKKTTTAVKDQGGHIFLQMWHCGRASHSDFHNGELPLSASAVKLNGDKVHTPQGKKDYETPKAMTIQDITRTVQDYKRAAQNAKEAGFDGVEIHGANGYLINQFTESKTNQRDDEYGGSMENRFRFFKEIVEAVLEVFPAHQVGARISPNGVFNDMGSDDFREMNLYIATQLNNYKLGYLHVMDGLGFGFHEKGEPMTLKEFRDVFTGTLIGNCGYDFDTAKKRIDDNEADLIAFGRPYITNPDLVSRLQNNHPLTPYDDMTKWYSPGPEGYTDYKPYNE